MTQLHPLQPGRKHAAISGLLLCLLLSLSWPAAATPRDKKQNHDGLIFGTVWDAKGSPVYGVRVKIRRASDKKARWELYSNHLGEFEQLLPAGKYVIWADIKRPKDAKKGDQSHPWTPPQVTVEVQNDIRTDIGLHLTE